MKNALNCIVCDKELENVFEEAQNQPYEGLSFVSYGHYGGTAFDPMDGRYLEVNICDECLLKKHTNIFLGQDRRLVTISSEFGNTVIGTTKVYRQLTPWKPEVESETDPFHLDNFEEFLQYSHQIDTRFSGTQIKEMFEK